MQIYDTLQSKLVDLEFKVEARVSMYVCGITPYDAAHLGHIFTFLAYDLLQRRLEESGYEVRLVRNVTDVDEPIFVRAAELGISYQELADRETLRLEAVMEQLHMRKPYAEPNASQYIAEMATAVAYLLSKGYAYKLFDDVYFDVSHSNGNDQQLAFGSFSGFSDRLLRGFMASRGGDPDRPGKRNPLDFLLWRGIRDPLDTAAWDQDAPLGRGRPGWHIECSVMSMALLGASIDIHGGGMDLIFPHHECEIAQNSALVLAVDPTVDVAVGVALVSADFTESSVKLSVKTAVKPFVRHWMHVAPLSYHGEKMSKSLGNLVFAHDLLENYSPAVLRLALMHYHYRIGGEWQDQFLGRATCLARLLQKAANCPNGIDMQPYLARIRSALDDDLDTPLVLRILQEMAAAKCASDTPYATCPQDFQTILSLLGLINPADTTDLSKQTPTKLL